jgi:hypothetical protein
LFQTKRIIMATKPLIPKPKKLADAEQQNTIKNHQASLSIPKLKPFRQVPHTEPDAKITLSVPEWEQLQDFFNVFARPIQVMQDVMRRNMDTGVVTIKYVDPEGKEIPKEDIEAYMKEVREYLDAGGSPDALYAQQKTEQDASAEPTAA